MEFDVKKTITAIITTFNRADIVPDAITSVQQQTYPVDEIIVVDDGSIDHTAETIKVAFSKSTIPSRYIHKLNGGMATSLNLGIREATTELLAFLDDDDLWAEDHIEKSIQVLENTPNAECVISLREEKGKKQAPPPQLLTPYEQHPTMKNVLIHKKAPLERPFFTSTVGTCIVTKSLATQLLFDIDAGARLDILFFWRLSEFTDIALSLDAHGIGRQFRTSYLSTDDKAPQEIKNKITLRRNSDEIRMLSKLVVSLDPTRSRNFKQMLKQAIIGRIYLNRKMGNFTEARKHLGESWSQIPIYIAVKEFFFCLLRIT